MNENRFRLCLVVLFTVFVAGVLTLGLQFTSNGRYIQTLPTTFGGWVFDTRTGEVLLRDPQTGVIQTYWEVSKIAQQQAYEKSVNERRSENHAHHE